MGVKSSSSASSPSSVDLRGHTPLPWTWKPCLRDGNEIISGAVPYDANGKMVYSIDQGDSMGLSDEVAALIVHRVNTWQALRDALMSVIENSLLPVVCEHDAEPDFCDGCAFKREKALGLALEKARRAIDQADAALQLAESRQGEVNVE